MKEVQRRRNTAVKATIASVDDMVTVTTVAIIADNRVVVDLGNHHRTAEVEDITMEHKVVVVTAQCAIFYSGSICLDHMALIDDHFMLSSCLYHHCY